MHRFGSLFLNPVMTVLFLGILLFHFGCVSSDPSRQYGQLSYIKREVGQGDSVDKPVKTASDSYYKGFTLLHYAVLARNLEGVRYLIDKGADVNIRGGVNGRTPLQEALEFYQIFPYEIIKTLILAGADVNIKPRKGADRPLHHLCDQKTNYSRDKKYKVPGLEDKILEIAELMVKKGADVNAAGYEDRTPLYSAVSSNRLALVRYLLKNGADPNSGYAIRPNSNRYNIKYNPLLDAAYYRMNLKMIATLFEGGLKVDNSGSPNVNVLECAFKNSCGQKCNRVFWLLVENGVDIKKFGGSALVTAAKYGAGLKIVRFLVENGADINYKDNNVQLTVGSRKFRSVPMTPVYHAATSRTHNRQTDIVQYLIENGAAVPPVTRDVIKYFHKDISGGDIDRWQAAWADKEQNSVQQVVAQLVPDYEAATTALKSFGADYLLAEDYAQLTRQWRLLAATPTRAEATAEGRRIIADLQALKGPAEKVFAEKVKATRHQLRAMQTEFARLSSSRARRFSQTAYAALKKKVNHARAMLPAKGRTASGDLKKALELTENWKADFTAVYANIKGGQKVLQGARTELGFAQTAFKEISVKKAVIYAPEKYAAAKQKLQSANQALRVDHASSLPAIRAASKDATSARQLVMQIDRQIPAQAVAAATAAATMPTVAAKGANPDLPKRKRQALVIGVDRYRNFPDLQNAVNDAKAVSHALRLRYGFQTIDLYNEQATREGIYESFRRIASSLQEGDVLLLYYAGHGWVDDVFKEGYWIPHDGRKGKLSSYLGNAELHRLIQAMEKAQHILVVADSCFSGSFLTRSAGQRGFAIRPVSAKTSPRTLNRFFRKVDNRKSRMVLTSGANEPVPDGGRDGHSIFGYYFLRALTAPDDTVYTSSELLNRVRKVVSNNSNQTPLAGELKGAGHESGQLVFVVTPIYTK